MELWGRVGTPGVAVGLAWTVQGGCITMVEATKLAGGEGKLILTGHLGKVMRESAQLALNWVRGVAQQYGLVQQGEDLMNDIDVHIHFPEGAVSKDGPSAGITIATALVSLFADVPLVPGLAISGELTLRGVVLPVGGIREKLLAAHSTGLKKVILPKRCIKDLFYVPQTIKDEMSFLFVDHMEEVIDAAFDGLVAPVSHPSFQSKLWLKVEQNTAAKRLQSLQRQTCVSITGALSSCPTLALEVALGYTTLEQEVMRTAALSVIKLLGIKVIKTASSEGHIKTTQEFPEAEMLTKMSEAMVKKYSFEKPYTFSIKERENG
ncbi:hypothetical protein J6590_011851 [Homalodisca vitripennis]|nr:hypothetical protein J6590_011851 [Homalodisca vitripennis]